MGAVLSMACKAQVLSGRASMDTDVLLPHTPLPQQASQIWVGSREGNQHALGTYPLPRDFEAAACFPKMGRIKLLETVKQVHEHHLAHNLLAWLELDALRLHRALDRGGC